MKILFICTGNATRSPACEAVLRQMLADKGITGITVESAGLIDHEGLNRDYRMVEAAMDRGYIIGGTSRKLTPEIAKGADFIIYMEDCHFPGLMQILPEMEDRMFLFNDICFGEDDGLDDPSCGTPKDVWNTLDRIEEGCKRLVGKLTDEFWLRSHIG